MHLYCLRVSKTTAGRSFPFDRVYLLKYDDRAVIERLFRYALVLPVEEVVKKQLKKVDFQIVVDRPHHRDDDAKLNATAVWADLDEGEWVMVVPLLPKWLNKNMPQYLAAEAWFETKRNRLRSTGKRESARRESPFSARSYLQTPNRKVRPICVVCPRMIMHQNGECHLGQPVCFESLPLGMVNHFEEAMAVPDPTPNELEPEEYELLDGEEFVPNVAPAPNNRAKDLLRIINE